MTKTAQRIAAAFRDSKALRIKNTYTDGQNVWHHGHRIASRCPASGAITVTMCGWGTATTRDRLNAIVRVCAPWRGLFSQRKFQQYFGDTPIASDDTVVLNP